MPSTGKNMISDLYEEERDAALKDYYDSKQQAFSIRIDARTAAILEGVAKRFGKSRNSILADILRIEAETMWDELEQKDRFLVAENGDVLLEKVGADNPTLLTPKERKMRILKGKEEDIDYAELAEIDNLIDQQTEEEGIRKAEEEKGIVS